MTDKSFVRPAKRACGLLLATFLLGVLVPGTAFAVEATQKEALPSDAPAVAEKTATADDATAKAVSDKTADQKKASTLKAASDNAASTSSVEDNTAQPASKSSSEGATLTAQSTMFGTNQSFSAARNVPVGKTTQGTLTDSGLMYSFTLPQSGKVTINATVGLDLSSISLYDQTHEDLKYHKLDWNADFKKAELTTTWYLRGGTYYIGFDKRTGAKVSSGLATFNLSYRKSIESFPETQSNNNDASGRANAVSVNKTFYGFLSYDEREDWHKVTLPSSGLVKVVSKLIDKPTKSVNFKIYSAKTGDLLHSSLSSYAKEINLAQGTYYFVPCYFSWSTGAFLPDLGDYSMNLQFTSAKESFADSDGGSNNSSATASAIKLDTAYKGQIALNDEKDYYRFQVTKKTNIMLSLITNYGTGLFEFYNSNGTRIAYCNLDDAGKQGSAGKYHNENMGTFNPGTYYFMAGVAPHASYENPITGEYQFIVHTQHAYKKVVTKATPSKLGHFVYRCYCGHEKNYTLIARPSTIKLSATNLAYNGKVRTPKVTVKDDDGKMVSSKYYTVTYSKGRKAIGTYKAKIVFKGDYKGTVTRTFKITPKTTSISKLTRKSKGFIIKWKKQKTQTSGYQIQYSRWKGFYSGFTTTKTVKKNTTTKLTVSKLAKKTRYYVKVRTYKKINGKTFYSKWSKVRAIWTK